jgi:hypothetical protein
VLNAVNDSACAKRSHVLAGRIADRMTRHARNSSSVPPLREVPMSL